jgi:hypothetical protein
MDRRAAPGSLLRSFERHLRAQNRSERDVGNYLESARLAEAFLGSRARLRADVPGLPGPDERAARGPYPDLTDAELRTGLDLMPSRVAATSTGR